MAMAYNSQQSTASGPGVPAVFILVYDFVQGIQLQSRQTERK